MDNIHFMFHLSDKEFEKVLSATARKARINLPAPIMKAIFSALSERDEKAEICRKA